MGMSGCDAFFGSFFPLFFFFLFSFFGRYTSHPFVIPPHIPTYQSLFPYIFLFLCSFSLQWYGMEFGARVWTWTASKGVFMHRLDLEAETQVVIFLGFSSRARRERKTGQYGSGRL